MLICQRAAAKQCRECTIPQSEHCFRLSPILVTAFHKTQRNLIISETYNPFQIWLRLASSWKTLLHADRQCDHANFISLGNQANRSNSEKQSRYNSNRAQHSASVKCEVVVTVQSSNREKNPKKQEGKEQIFPLRCHCTDGIASKITFRSLLWEPFKLLLILVYSLTCFSQLPCNVKCQAADYMTCKPCLEFSSFCLKSQRKGEESWYNQRHLDCRLQPIFREIIFLSSACYQNSFFNSYPL